MFSDEKLIELICYEEMILEGLDKSSWRLIKLATPQVWEHQCEMSEEYSWVLGFLVLWGFIASTLMVREKCMLSLYLIVLVKLVNQNKKVKNCIIL
ncbi:hypothetical protein BCU23_13470 [Vibrio splendidus]|nr:hypothetical protein BCU23_13470 [Vibrio splendidus]